MKPTLVDISLEPNSINPDACAVTLYFDGVPSKEQVREVCETKLSGLSLGVDTNDQFFGFEEHPNPVSERAKLRRYEVYPTC